MEDTDDTDGIDYRRRYGELIMKLTTSILDKSFTPPEWLHNLVEKDISIVLYNEQLEQNQLKKKHGNNWKLHYNKESTI